MDLRFLQQEYWHNTLQDYTVAATILLVLLGVLRFIRAVVLRRLREFAEKTETTLDDFLVEASEQALMPLLNFGVFYFATTFLVLPAKADSWLRAGSAVLLVFFGVRFILTAIRYFLEVQLAGREGGKEKLGQLRGLMVVIGGAVWTLGAVFLLDNFGYDVTAIVTGLGIGGIAIALAAQNILGDLFNYFVIFFDRPFEVGDSIVVDDKRGVIEQIGIKTTRIRSLTGEELIMANTSLTGSRIHNFRRLDRRRALLQLGVVYGTSAEKLRRIPAIVKEIVTVEPAATYERCHFFRYGPSSLDFEAVYFVERPDMLAYMDVQERVNLAIYEAFAREGIEFAFPTQTVHVQPAAR
jgi:small-conductance mechanosensitive channel